MSSVTYCFIGILLIERVPGTPPAARIPPREDGPPPSRPLIDNLTGEKAGIAVIEGFLLICAAASARVLVTLASNKACFACRRTANAVRSTLWPIDRGSDRTRNRGWRRLGIKMR